ncbi:uncharacterized protein [Temnothorax nylanderi]|uniref:uncharacterized protein n=1 Tax=Temnothorax nylanderi TaxID=102681 RepID=UPI003A88F9A5
MKTISDYLKEWNLEKYIHVFEDEEIDNEDFLDLAPEKINQIFPKAGPYSRFMKNFKKLKEENDNDFAAILSSIESVPSNSVFEVSVIQDLVTETASAIHTCPEIDPLNEVNNTRPQIIDPTPAPSNEDNLSELSILEINRIPSVAKKSRLYSLLMSKVSGRTIISSYEAGGLNESSRRKLAALVIEDELGGDIHMKIKTQRFLALRDEIVSIFPEESKEVYYVPYEKINGVNYLARGKLLDKYYNLVKTLKRSGVNRGSCSSENNPANEQDVSEITTEIISKSLRWLAVCVEPWQMVEHHWALTSKHRMKELQAAVPTNSDLSKTRKGAKRSRQDAVELKRNLKLAEEQRVSNYMTQYLALSQPLGYTLLETDFNLQYTDAANRLIDLWPEFKVKLVRLLISSRSAEDEEEIEGASDATILMNFAQVISPKNIIEDGFPLWRPTREEIQEGFLVHVHTAGDIKPVLSRLRDKALAREDTVQPYPIIVGPSLDRITDSYLVLDSKLYSVESPLRAVDVTFKAFFALHAKFPKHATPLWLILQKSVYGINTKWDNMRNFPALPPIITKLKCQ